MTFDISLHEACVRVGGRAGVRYVITKFSQMDSLPNFLTHGALLCSARAWRARGAPLLRLHVPEAFNIKRYATYTMN